MSAYDPTRRKLSARANAVLHQMSERSIRRIQAEPRDQYVQRAHERGEQILAWREQGILWREIADRLDITVNAALKAGQRAKRRRDEQMHGIDPTPPVSS